MITERLFPYLFSNSLVLPQLLYTITIKSAFLKTTRYFLVFF